jgi:hypothetical protein
MNRTPISRVEHVAVLLVITAAMFTGLSAVPFHPDESHWIGLSAPFEAFVTGHFTDPIWQQRQDKATNGTITYSVIGAARRAGGFTPDRLNPPWQWRATDEENVAEGRVPEPRLLWWGRAGVTAAAIAGIFVTFMLWRRAAGPSAACLWLALVLVNPYLRMVLRRAMNEGVLLLLLALAAWATTRAVPHLGRPARAPGARSRAVAWLVAAAVAAGLAAQTKLNGSLAVPGIMLVAALAAARSPLSWRGRIRRVSLAGLLIAVVSYAAFVGTNPSMWPDPFRDSVRSIRARAETVRAQSLQPNARDLAGVPGRARIVATRVFRDYALVPLPVASSILFLIGSGLAGAGLLGWLRRAGGDDALVSLVVIGAGVSVPMLFTPLDWERYYLLPVFFFGLPTVNGVDWLARRVWQSLSAARGRK